MSQTSIAKSRHMSKTSVSEDIRDKTPEESYEIFYLDRLDYSYLFTLPDYAYIHKELSRTGVILKLLWKEYGDKCVGSGNLLLATQSFAQVTLNLRMSFSEYPDLVNCHRTAGHKVSIDFSIVGYHPFYIGNSTIK